MLNPAVKGNLPLAKEQISIEGACGLRVHIAGPRSVYAPLTRRRGLFLGLTGFYLRVQKPFPPCQFLGHLSVFELIVGKPKVSVAIVAALYPAIFSLERGYYHPGRTGRTAVDIYPHVSSRL